MNSLDIGEKYIDQLKNINTNINNNMIDNTNNNYQYKTTLINIDSKYRNKTSSNIVSMHLYTLPPNIIETTLNSNIVKIHISGHNYNMGDMIILQNVHGKKVILSNNITLLKDLNYFMVNINNHNITTNGDYRINIMKYDNTSNSYTNVMINSILGIHNIEIYDSNIHNIEDLNIYNENNIKTNYFFIKLPYKCITTTTCNCIFQCEIMNIGGIPLQNINANYPINYNNYQSSHEIIQADINAIYFYSSYKAIYSELGGGDKITIGKVINTIEGYIDPSNYVYKLNTTFNNVVKLEIVSSEINYTDMNITCNNNKLYWQYLEDGDHIYEITIPDGYYNRESLTTYMKNNMNNMKRINAEYNVSFDINIFNTTNEVQFSAFTWNDGERVPTTACFLFNRLYNIGDILGFKYCGEPCAITPFSHITSNMNNYITSQFDKVHNTDCCINIFNNINNYLFLYINDYENMLTNPNMMNCFTKILIKKQFNNEIMFNTFIKHSPMVFLIPQSCISEFKIKFLLPDGTKPNFRNIDHSFTLKVTEIITQCYNTGLNSKNYNYLETISKINYHS